MHPTAMSNCRSFFESYEAEIRAKGGSLVVEIGSQDVYGNGNLRSICPSDFRYVGVDFVPGKGVDLVLDDPYALPFESNTVDVVLSSSCFEHSELFWLLFMEILRVLKLDGLFYLNVPSNGMFHRFPVDCWRFYPDSGRALVTWAKRNGVAASLLESYISAQSGGPDGQWNDFVAVFLKDEKLEHRYPRRILQTRNDYFNGLLAGSEQFLNHAEFPEDMIKLSVINRITTNQVKVR
jgi:SAM-dependent methyltransferase